MNMTWQTALVRNILISGTNGAITLIILLIAPLGLAAVMINTALVVVATFTTAQTADQVIRFLQGGQSPEPGQARARVRVLSEDEPGQMNRRS